MRLLEAIIAANEAAVATGNRKAELDVTAFAESLPLAALTCIDARLNKLVPEMLGVPEEKFIWLRNAGNIITGPTSSTMRSLALACAVKGGKEIVVIGHSDCQVAKHSTMQLLDGFAKLGVTRAKRRAKIFFASNRRIRGLWQPTTRSPPFHPGAEAAHCGTCRRPDPQTRAASASTSPSPESPWPTAALVRMS